MNAPRYASTLLAAAALIFLAAPLSAQVDDARWLPYVGCWEAEEGGPDSDILCFRPSGDGVEMESWVEGEVVASELLVADGEARPIVAEGCEGTESVRFSENGRRAFTESRIECGGDTRSGTGIMAWVGVSKWIDVRALTIQGETVSWVQGYTPVSAERLTELGIEDPEEGMLAAIHPARLITARPIVTDDVVEAARRVDDEAVVAWVAAQSEPFELDGQELVRLADAGVPEDVIDVMVAVTYPERFVVEADAPPAAAEGDFVASGRRIPLGVGVGYRSYLMYDPFDPFGYYRYGSRFGYSPYGGFGYSPYGYSPYGYGGYGYGYYGPRIIRIERRAPASQSRAVYGRGWTRSGGSGGPAARPRGSSGSSGGAYRGSAGSGGSRAGSARPTRRAKPRGGRGGF